MMTAPMPNSTASKVREDILAIIAKEAHVDPTNMAPETTLKDLDISSLEVLEILFAIEEHFNISLPERDPGFETTSVGGLVTVLERFILAKGAPATTR